MWLRPHDFSDFSEHRQNCHGYGIRWNEAPGCYYMEVGPRVDIYNYLLESGISLGFQTCILSHGEKYTIFHNFFIYMMDLCLISRR
ncbi:Uncharacterized protein TCM_018295 [Theobroma cacao]|uniref:Uncharacterized protein n=1 Tax=Theobroma cacao TaxID=3641 RepID=A0A061EG29_THECC|nr:Uncharacterized protein TCM_018295 [Theobroma cacao]